ncbi:MAG: hypothetical protein BGO14_05155 [Chlamydiales bacterium 38-26]|nr:hypothetical protein [Chlamydiales bacterium]OJV07863.1 MAG: hypothetical protein BGO14_05155 [Chlamydiales bacterium 38-26]
MNDNGQIIGYSPLLRRHCFLDKGNIVDFIPQCSSEFTIISGLLDINNNCMLLGSGQVWNENHFLIFKTFENIK